MSLFPLTFTPRLLEKMWGGRKIHTVLGKDLPPAKQIGESWELYDFPPGVVDKSPGWISAPVAAGPLAGKTLHELVLEFGRDLLGDVPLVGPQGQFPLLIKFLDAKEDLSIQVHPDRKYADANPGAYLKSEAWYIVQSDPGSRLFKGLKPGVTAGQFKHSIAHGHCEQLLISVRVKPGECFYLPSGTVHAVGAGILAAEVQTPSDTTFRVYDFNRVEPSTGRQRQLHVDEALACINFAEQTAPPVHHRKLMSCEFFEMKEIVMPPGAEQSVPTGRPAVWIMLDGQVRITASGATGQFGRGDTVLLPAAMRNPVFKTAAPSRWLEIGFPK
jgi:mannose-6-phosphate isomerase